MVLEKPLESPLDYKEVQPVHPKGNQSWIFIGTTDAETSILWLPDAKNQLTGKDPDAGKDWRWEEKGTTEDEMAGWHHQCNGHELSRLREMVMDREVCVLQSMGSQRVGHDWGLNWTKTVYRGFPSDSDGKEPACQYRRHKIHRFDPWVRKIPAKGSGNLLQDSCLENFMDRGTWQAIVLGVRKSQARLRVHMHTTHSLYISMKFS